MSLRYRTTPFPHQKATLEGGTIALRNPVGELTLAGSKDRPSFGLFHEPGLGKSKVILDQAVYLYDSGLIDAVLVLAPNGVHRNWERNEVPAHVPEDLLADARVLCWSTDRKATKDHQHVATELLRTHATAGRLKILMMSYDALMTPEGASFAKRYLERYRALLAADESHAIKSPKAKRTIRALAWSRYAPFRRIATATPITSSPFDLYTQVRLLDPMAWNEIGCASSLAFRNTFGVFEKKEIRGKLVDLLATDATGRPIYKNLGLLRSIVAKHGSRLVKDRLLDLPPKSYTKRYFDLEPKARRIYRDLREDFLVERESGILTAELSVVRTTRFQQVTSGYLPASDLDPKTMTPVSERNPRVDLLLEVFEEIGDRPTIVWAKFNPDVDRILAALASRGIRAVRYDGQVSDDERLENLEAFQKHATVNVLVSKASVGGVGLTITRAEVEIFYNTTFRPEERIQAEDRVHRLGLDHPVAIYDLVAKDTIDEYILVNLRSKRDTSDVVLGDDPRPWI